jgi:YebC/PmpR family DNA-binding regulatory protein
MSGHSKWAGIKHKKALVDAKRGSNFTKIANMISVAARQGGGDAGMNPNLRLSIEKARSLNMPKDNIERAIKRGTGELGGAVTEELLYEGFGPGNICILVEVLTDNRNRSGADVRLLFIKNGGRFAEGGGVAYQFTSTGVIRLAYTGDTSNLEELLIEGGADDYELEDGTAVVKVSRDALHPLREQLEQVGYKVDSANVEHVPNTLVELNEEDEEKALKLLDILEGYDDVTAVYTNLAGYA